MYSSREVPTLLLYCWYILRYSSAGIFYSAVLYCWYILEYSTTLLLLHSTVLYCWYILQYSWIQIQIFLRMPDPDPYIMYTDPQPWSWYILQYSTTLLLVHSTVLYYTTVLLVPTFYSTLVLKSVFCYVLKSTYENLFF
jgi:hypothetical protein